MKDGAALDHETKPRLTVTLTANDGSGTSNSTAAITVTIHVIDADEVPRIIDRADTTAKGEQTVPYAENGTGPVATFTARDPEGASPIVWSLAATNTAEIPGLDVNFSLDAADVDDFKIDQHGVLSFITPPDFEDDSVSGAGTDSDNYQVVVQGF